MFEADLDSALNTGHRLNVLVRRASSSPNLTAFGAGDPRGGRSSVGSVNANGLLMLLKPTAELCQRLRPVAEAVFNVFAQFGEGLLVPVRNKQRVISEPSFARRRE